MTKFIYYPRHYLKSFVLPVNATKHKFTKPCLECVSSGYLSKCSK